MSDDREVDRIQIPIEMELGRQLKKLAVDMQPYIPRDRAMERGPMLAYLARWLTLQPFDRQVAIIAEGKATDEGQVTDVPSSSSVKGRDGMLTHETQGRKSGDRVGARRAKSDN